MKKIRYAVVGLGHIAQTAVLPAFEHARSNSELAALISTDPLKLKRLGRRYKVPHCYPTEQFEECLKAGNIDALYIATPNTDHQIYAERAAEMGIHVLCEKPLATTATACRSIMDTAQRNNVKLMVAYRLHFDAANLQAIEIAQSGKLGNIRIFNSVFSFAVKDMENIRLKKDKGGGPLFDIGIYCINAARYLFRDEPEEVVAFAARDIDDLRFNEVPEMLSVSMRFPNEGLANFVCSFAAADSSHYHLLGTKGSLELTSAYDYAEPMTLTVCENNNKPKSKKFAKRDQFAPELIYFSKCILENRQPEPSAAEGLADLNVIEAIQQSISGGCTIRVKNEHIKKEWPSMKQEIYKAAVRRPPPTVHATSPSTKH